MIAKFTAMLKNKDIRKRILYTLLVCDILPANLADIIVGGAGQICAVQQDLSLGDLSIAGQQPHQREGGGGFSAAGLAHQPKAVLLP